MPPSNCPDILSDIATQRRRDVETAKVAVSVDELMEKIEAFDESFGAPLNVLDRVYKDTSHVAVAAEFKRASPSKGDIAAHLDPNEQAQIYTEAGASVISVLTEPTKFKGSLEDMLSIRKTVQRISSDRPAVLRKDFIIDEYQLLEARAYGADTVLLIVAILESELLDSLVKASRRYGMEPLVEVNNEEELKVAIEADARFIGVNNRNLHTFKLDMNTTIRIADELSSLGITQDREGVTLFALSGISSRADVEPFEKCGVRGILVGESLMKSANAAEMIQELQGKSHEKKNTVVKICGITDVPAAMEAVRHGANMIGMIFVPNTPRSVSIDQGKAIVAAVRDFGERTTRMDLFEGMEHVRDEKKNSVWFQSWAKHIQTVSKKTPLVVGVFMDQSPDDINHIARQVGVDMVQLHGDEGYEICQDIALPCSRVIHLPDSQSVETVALDTILEHIEPGLAVSILLDTTVKGKKGGTGKSFDWTVAQSLSAAGIPCIMAGGLTPDNIKKALRKGRPMAVDVSSGVELDGGKPGEKDFSKIRHFIESVRLEDAHKAHTTIDEEEE